MHPSNIVRAALRRAGLDVQRYRGEPRACLVESMRSAEAIGFSPATITDVGAARGGWTRKAAEVWPKAHYILVDPLVENELALSETCQRLHHAEYHLVAVDKVAGTTVINVHRDLDGSSIFLERETGINGTPRCIPTATVTELVAECHALAPILLKADVQGAEMRVLEGALPVLDKVEMIVLEVLLFDFFQGQNPQLHDVVGWLHEQGFVTWDIFGQGYRPLDHALSQVDMVFVKNAGMFRTKHEYASEEQRMCQFDAIAARDHARIR